MLQISSSKTLQTCALVEKINICMYERNTCFMLSGGLSFFLCGYAFAFGDGSSFIGYENFLLIGVDNSKYASFFFQVI